MIPNLMNLRRITLCLALAAGLTTGSSFLSPPVAQAAIVERIVAIVGSQAILLTEIRERALPLLVRIYGTIPEGSQRTQALSQVYSAVLERMVNEELEARAAKNSGISITSTEVEEALARVSSQNNMSVNQILGEAKRSGLTEKAYRGELRRQLLQAKMTQLRLTGRIKVNDRDLQKAYRTLQSRERMQLTQRTLRLRILAGRTKSEKAKQKLLAASIADAAQEGGDFRELVQKHSVSPENALGPALPPLQETRGIQRATMALEVGETSRPIRDGNHWLIIQVIERPPSQLPPFQDVRAEVHQQVYMEKMAKAREHWLKSLRRRTHVEIRL